MGIDEDYLVADSFQEELLMVWWNLWKEQVLPYQRYKDTERHDNLRVEDICLLKYDNKVKATYCLCIIREIFHSNGGVVCNVTVGYRPRKLCGGSKKYKPSPLEIIPVGVQRMVLICPAEELNLGVGKESLENEVEPAHRRSLATKASDAKKVSEEVTTKDIFPDVYARDSITNSPEGLEAELEGHHRAQFSSLPLPDPMCSAEQATKGRGYPQVYKDVPEQEGGSKKHGVSQHEGGKG